METRILEDIGLSQNEIKVFLALLDLGTTKAINIIQHTTLQSSSVYNAIHLLIEKGLVSYIKKSQIKYYKAADPEAVLGYVDAKRKELERIMPELKARQVFSAPDGVEIYKSYKGIRTVLSELLIGAEKGDVMRYFAVQDPEKYDVAKKMVFSIQRAIRREKQVVSKGLFHESLRGVTKGAFDSQRRFLDFPMPPNMMLFRDKVAIISWDEEPVAILIESASIAQEYINFFEHLWKVGKA